MGEPVFDFWTRSDPTQPWPEIHGYVFLAPFMLNLGHAMFPADWRDIDPAVDVEPWDPDLARGAADLDPDTRAALARRRGRDPLLRKLAASPAGSVRREMIPDLSAEGRAGSYSRSLAVQRKVAALVQASLLETVVRRENGSLTRLVRADWQVESIARYSLCKLDPRKPSSRKINSPEHGHIFGTEASAARSLAAVRAETTAAASEPPCKSKPGPKSLEEADRPLLEEMKQLLKSGRAQSIEAAARQLAPRAAGHATEDSKKERLARRFRRDNRSE
jgi:hypothetical protein